MGVVLQNLTDDDLCSMMCPDPLMDRLEESGIHAECAQGATALCGFDDAIIGFADEGRFVYSYEKMLQVLKDQGVDAAEAVACLDTDVLEWYQQFGEQPPIIMYEVK